MHDRRMTESKAAPQAGIQSIFHPSDFSQASEVAFAHALKIAFVTRGTLSVLHVASDNNADWTDFPGVRETLERWHLIPKGSGRGAVADLGIRVRKVVQSSSDPVKACLQYLARRPADLIVLAVRQRERHMRWLDKSVGQPIAQGAGEMTLFIPHGVPGFVSKDDGTVSLKSILIPIAARPPPQPAVEAAARLIRNLQLPPGAVTLFHVGSPGEMPAVKIPNDTAWTWHQRYGTGDPAHAILSTASETAADLIVMTTEGPNGFLDALRGSTSEQVLHQAKCPLASLPMGSFLG
jgi:nucleotide-binding universal stress UspA family protein